MVPVEAVEVGVGTQGAVAAAPLEVVGVAVAPVEEVDVAAGTCGAAAAGELLL